MTATAGRQPSADVNADGAGLPAFRPPGWLGRIGVIQPAPGLMLEYEWARAMPDGVMYPVTRLPLGGGTSAHYSQMAALAPGAAATLANAQAGVIAYACAVGSLHQGPQAEEQLMASLSLAAGGRKVIGMAQAAVNAMRHLGARRIAVLTPYTDDINQLVADYLLACGFAVSNLSRLPTVNAITAAELQPQETGTAAINALDAAPDADLLWIACSNVRSLDLIDAIEKASGKLMISSNQAMLWRALRELGVKQGPANAGSLFLD